MRTPACSCVGLWSGALKGVAGGGGAGSVGGGGGGGGGGCLHTSFAEIWVGFSALLLPGLFWALGLELCVGRCSAVKKKMTPLSVGLSMGSMIEKLSPVAVDMTRLVSLSCSWSRKMEPLVFPHACCTAWWSSISSRVAFEIFPEELRMSAPWAMTSLACTASAVLGE